MQILNNKNSDTNIILGINQSFNLQSAYEIEKYKQYEIDKFINSTPDEEYLRYSLSDPLTINLRWFDTGTTQYSNDFSIIGYTSSGTISAEEKVRRSFYFFPIYDTFNSIQTLVGYSFLQMNNTNSTFNSNGIITIDILDMLLLKKMAILKPLILVSKPQFFNAANGQRYIFLNESYGSVNALDYFIIDLNHEDYTYAYRDNLINLYEVYDFDPQNNRNDKKYKVQDIISDSKYVKNSQGKLVADSVINSQNSYQNSSLSLIDNDNTNAFIVESNNESLSIIFNSVTSNTTEYIVYWGDNTDFETGATNEIITHTFASTPTKSIFNFKTYAEINYMRFLKYSEDFTGRIRNKIINTLDFKGFDPNIQFNMNNLLFINNTVYDSKRNIFQWSISDANPNINFTIHKYNNSTANYYISYGDGTVDNGSFTDTLTINKTMPSTADTIWDGFIQITDTSNNFSVDILNDVHRMDIINNGFIGLLDFTIFKHLEIVNLSNTNGIKNIILKSDKLVSLNLNQVPTFGYPDLQTNFMGIDNAHYIYTNNLLSVSEIDKFILGVQKTIAISYNNRIIDLRGNVQPISAGSVLPIVPADKVSSSDWNWNPDSNRHDPITAGAAIKWIVDNTNTTILTTDFDYEPSI